MKKKMAVVLMCILVCIFQIGCGKSESLENQLCNTWRLLPLSGDIVDTYYEDGKVVEEPSGFEAVWSLDGNILTVRVYTEDENGDQNEDYYTDLIYEISIDDNILVEKMVARYFFKDGKKTEDLGITGVAGEVESVYIKDSSLVDNQEDLSGYWVSNIETDDSYPATMTLNSDGTGSGDGLSLNWYVKGDILTVNIEGIKSYSYSYVKSGKYLVLDQYLYEKQ